MKTIPFICSPSFSSKTGDRLAEDFAKDLPAYEEPLPVPLLMRDGFVISRGTYTTEVGQETTDEK
jgi:hypothetical protein